MFTIKVKMEKNKNDFKTIKFHGDNIKKSLGLIHSILEDREKNNKFNPDHKIYKIIIEEGIKE